MAKRIVIGLIVFFAVFTACKTIDEDYITPDWVQEKIALLSNDCSYKGTVVYRTVLYTSEADSTYLYQFSIPNNYFPELEVYSAEGDKFPWNDSFTYTDYLAVKKINRIVWSYPENSCP